MSLGQRGDVLLQLVDLLLAKLKLLDQFLFLLVFDLHSDITSSLQRLQLTLMLEFDKFKLPVLLLSLLAPAIGQLRQLIINACQLCMLTFPIIDKVLPNLF